MMKLTSHVLLVGNDEFHILEVPKLTVHGLLLLAPKFKLDRSGGLLGIEK